MNPLLEMLPFYLLGNFHCLGMCGPFALAMGGHNDRLYYLLGRFFGFTLASFIAAIGGEILSLTPLAPLFPFVIGILFLLFFFSQGLKVSLPFLKKLELLSTTLLLKGGKGPLFLFGLLTLFLPCGQSLLLYGTSALNGSATFGLLNGAIFALLTTPSLLLAMRLRPYLHSFSKGGDRLLRVFALVTGLLAMARGFSDLGFMPHLSYHFNSSFHLSLW